MQTFHVSIVQGITKKSSQVMDPREIDYEDGNSMELTYDRVQWQTLA